MGRHTVKQTKLRQSYRNKTMKGGLFGKAKVAPAPTASITFDTYINDFINKSIADRLNIKIEDIRNNISNSQYTGYAAIPGQIVDKYSELVEAEQKKPDNAGAIVYYNRDNILHDELLPTMDNVIYSIYPVAKPDIVLSQFRCKPADKITKNICTTKNISELVNFIANRKLKLDTLSGIKPYNPTSRLNTAEKLNYDRMIRGLRGILKKEVFFIIINILHKLKNTGVGLSGDGVMNFRRKILDNVENEVDDEITNTEDLITKDWKRYEQYHTDTENQKNLQRYNQIKDTVVYLNIVIMKLMGSSRTSNLLTPYNNTLFGQEEIPKTKSTPSNTNILARIEATRKVRAARKAARNAARNAARTVSAPRTAPPTRRGFIQRCFDGVCSLFRMGK